MAARQIDRPEKISTPATADFKSAFCDAFACPDGGFLETLFQMSLKPHLRPLAAVVRAIKPGFFRPDFTYLELLGETTSLREFRNLACSIPADPELTRGFWRKVVGLRISGARIFEIRKQVLAQRGEAPQ